ncbi:MAG: hypothetical protein WDZ59_10940 [Pirellulales bacterium]
MAPSIYKRSLIDDVPDLSENGDGALVLTLEVTDEDTVRTLQSHPEGEQRDAYALAALKVGVLALRHASGQLDADFLRRQCAQMLDGMHHRLAEHAQLVQHEVARELKNYFDPESGRFHERVQRLIQRDGDLEQVLHRHVGGQDSQLAKTLLEHVGEGSPLMKVLSPDESRGLLAALRESVDGQLLQQRERILREFSLDNPESALTRLVGELNESHGLLNKNMQEKIDVVVKEFSLDEENSALSRLVRNVDTAQRTIRSEFSLDNPDSAFSRLSTMLEDTQGAIHKNLTLDVEASPLARLKRELLEILGNHAKSSQQFQEEVKVTLGKIVAKREEADHSTRHGLQFEEAVCEFLSREAQAVGDVAEPTGSRPGMIKHCKVGDCVVELGPDSPAPASKIVVEAKEDACYNLAKAREQMETARKNRGAQQGLFVFSAKTAPSGLQPFARYGSDIVVAWDAEDPATDIFLRAGLVTARALCIRQGRQSESQSADFLAIQESILQIEKQATGLDEITRSAETIHSASEKILKRVRITRQHLDRQVEILNESLNDLKHTLSTEGSGTAAD